MHNAELAIIFSKYLGAQFKMKLPKESEWTIGIFNIQALHTLFTSRDWEFRLILKPPHEISKNVDLCAFIAEQLGISEMHYSVLEDRVTYGYTAVRTREIYFKDFPFPIIDQCRHLGYDFGYLNLPSLLDAMIADNAQSSEP